MSSGFKKANLVSMSKATTVSDKNVSTKIVAATFENEIGSEEVSGERVWRNYEYFDARKSDYSMEKVNFPENTLLYINQSYLTVKKNKENILLRFFYTRTNCGVFEPSPGRFLLHFKRERGEDGQP